MSFGFGVGDFIAVGKLITEITCCLRDVGGAKSDYQALVEELECLQKALDHIDRVQRGGSSASIESIRQTAATCRRPLEDFLGRIQRYGPSLGSGSQPAASSWKTSLDKARFKMGHADEARNLQGFLSILVGTLNILLAEHGLETMQVSAQTAAAAQHNIKERLDSTTDILHHVRSSVVRQTMAIRKIGTALDMLYRMISGEIVAPLKNLESMAAAVCTSTQQIYGVMLEIRTSLAARPDARWGFFQDPIIFEDVLGRKLPVPSEYDFSLLDAIIRQKFNEGPGSEEVRLGNYQILSSRDRHRVIEAGSMLLPGSTLIMSIVIATKVMTDQTCPIARCGSSQTVAVAGGGRNCCSCGVWFSQSARERQNEPQAWDATELEDAPDAEMEPNRKRRQTGKSQSPSRKKQKTEEIQFKYVSIAKRMIDMKSRRSFKTVRFSSENSRSSQAALNTKTITTETSDVIRRWLRETNSFVSSAVVVRRKGGYLASRQFTLRQRFNRAQAKLGYDVADVGHCPSCRCPPVHLR